MGPEARFFIASNGLKSQLILSYFDKFFPKHNLSFDQNIKCFQAGITNTEDQKAILGAVNTYLTHNEAQFMPSAPSQELAYKTTQAREPLPECVICMEKEVNNFSLSSTTYNLLLKNLKTKHAFLSIPVQFLLNKLHCY